MALRHPIIFAIVLSACHLSLQSSLFSLQPAVEALNEREIQLDELQNGNIERDYNDNDDFDDYGFERGQHASNKARFLSRSNQDYDDYLTYRKRALFKKRASVFRERSRLPSQHSQQQQAQLAGKFLKAIEEEREREREDEYREALHNMWNRYRDEESAIERELFNDNENNNIESDYPINLEDLSKKKKKRQRGDAEVAPSNWEDKRSMPLLPWLPASRKKRFPVTKRSPKVNENELSHSSAAAEGNDKVNQDLKGIFGDKSADSNDDKKKKKRSMDEMNHGDAHEQHVSSMMAPHHSHDSSSIDDKKRSLKKRSTQFDDDEDEPDNENENEEEDNDETEVEDSSEDDDNKKKKKREAAKKSLETVGAESFPEKKGAIKKKSLDWSNIFGVDRKKKRSNDIIFNRFESDRRKRMDEDPDDDDYEDPEDDYEDDTKKKRKRSRNEDRLDEMDRKLKAMKNLIIEDTARYYSHHDENLSPSETKEMRYELKDRLAAAYSLDKMRKAIARLKQSIAFQKALERNVFDSQISTGDDNDIDDDKKKAKRISVKKEKAEFDSNGHEIESPLKKVDMNENHHQLKVEEEDRKKKRTQKKSALTNNIDDDESGVAGRPMSEGYMGGKVFDENCPLVDAIEKRCRGIDLLSGDSHHNLLEACGAHQLCYLCGDSAAQCDYGYLYEIQDTCGHNLRCKLNGAQALKALQTFSGTKVGPRECVRNPCLNSALRSLGY